MQMGVLSHSEIQSRLNHSRITSLKCKDCYKVEEISPLKLIDNRRFDVMAKYIYAWFQENKIESQWGAALYDEHIWAFNQYDEDDGSGKRGIQSFYRSFDTTLQLIKKCGFDDTNSLIPVSRNGVPLDGAHRLAAALLYGKKVKIVRLNHDDNNNYNYDFFANKGLRLKWSDFIAYEYCKIKQNTHIIILLGADGSRELVKKALMKFGDIYYQKDIVLQTTGLKNLMMQLNVELWSKVEGLVSVFLLETKDNRQVSKMRKELQSLNRSDDIYFSESHQDTIQLAQIFFNENSLHFLNHASPEKQGTIKKIINEYKQSLLKSGKKTDHCCVVSDAVMAVYGMREASILEFIESDIEPKITITGSERIIPCKNNLSLRCSKDDIIFNPENHFYYDGIKFSSLHIVKQLKKRLKAKDREDIREINRILPKNLINKENITYNLKKKYQINRIEFGHFRMRCKHMIRGIIKFRS